jgi:TRAP transporter TAXI family solute receptor
MAIVVCGSVLSCGSDKPEEVRATVVFATGRPGSIYDELGTALAQSYSTKIPDLHVSARETQGSVANVEAIQRGTVDIGFVQADTAYHAYKRRSADFRTRVRGVAVLYVNAVQLVVRSDSPIRTVGDFRRRRVSVGRLGVGSPGEVAARVILDSYGVPVSDVDFRSNAQLTMDQFVSEVRNRQVDIGVLATSYPVLPLAESMDNVGMRLVPLDANRVSQIRLRYPFYKPIVIPSGTYPGQGTDVQTIGIDTLLVCREDLPEQLVHRLTKGFFDSLAELRKRHRAADLIDPEQGPATSVPLHSGAARFYRERELRRLTPIKSQAVE